MIRFLGEEFGFDIDLVNRVVLVRQMCRDNRNRKLWNHTGVELQYPLPPECFKWSDRGEPWHIWNLAWNDLKSANAKGSAMMKQLIVARA